MTLRPIIHNVYRFQDTCNVYALCSGDEAVLIDFGGGDILPELESLGIRRVADVLMTHHHRDQGQGLSRALCAGARVWVPQAEQDLFLDVDAHWQGCQLHTNYDVRQDRFSLLESIPRAEILHDYTCLRLGHYTLTVVPTPGHTLGSISLLTEVDGHRLAFTGDLIAAPGRVWSMSATQWWYNRAEGVAASIPSLVDLKRRNPDMLLPSHGEPMPEPGPAIDLLIERFLRLLRLRNQNLHLLEWIEQPYLPITPHLLWNRTSLAYSYVLLSESGKALLIDFGYDFLTSAAAAGSDRAARRPWLYSLGALKRKFNVPRIDVAVPTHYHDDHVAGLNLLREVEGTQVWTAQNFADILERPRRYDLPCLWFDPIPVDRVLPTGQPINWEEYTLMVYELPGHTLYAVAIAFEVDGRRVLATGDQYQGVKVDEVNYVYRNRFCIGDYRVSAALCRQLRPDLILAGHYAPIWVEPGYLEVLEERGEALYQLHHQLLPPELHGFGAEGFGARIQPYQAQGRAGEPIELEIEVSNPFEYDMEATVRVVVPRGWQAEPEEINLRLDPEATQIVNCTVTSPPRIQVRRARVAADLTVGDRHFGQQAEGLITVD